MGEDRIPLAKNVILHPTGSSIVSKSERDRGLQHQGPLWDNNFVISRFKSEMELNSLLYYVNKSSWRKD